MDVLKALFYYRPSGLLGAKEDNEFSEAERDVYLEEPKKEEDALIYEKPSVWTWLRKHAENNNERRQIFKRVYGISTVPGEIVVVLNREIGRPLKQARFRLQLIEELGQVSGRRHWGSP